jgi:hypothetical protein
MCVGVLALVPVSVADLPDPGSASKIKYFNPKKIFPSPRKNDLGCAFRIRIFSHPGSRCKKHQIPDPDPQHWFQYRSLLVGQRYLSCANTSLVVTKRFAIFSDIFKFSYSYVPVAGPIRTDTIQQFCGSWMFIPSPGSELFHPGPGLKYSGSRIRIRIFNLKTVSNFSKKLFFPSRIQGSKKHRIGIRKTAIQLPNLFRFCWLIFKSLFRNSTCDISCSFRL